MSALSFTLVMCGVLLNAVAQLLLKAGTNVVGTFEFSAANVWPIGWKLATQPFIVGGLGCYVISVVVWIARALAGIARAVRTVAGTGAVAARASGAGAVDAGGLG